MHKEVLQVSCRYLTRFLSYRKNPGGVIFTPPAPRGLNTIPIGGSRCFYFIVSHNQVRKISDLTRIPCLQQIKEAKEDLAKKGFKFVKSWCALHQFIYSTPLSLCRLHRLPPPLGAPSSNASGVAGGSEPVQDGCQLTIGAFRRAAGCDMASTASDRRSGGETGVNRCVGDRTGTHGLNPCRMLFCYLV